MNSKQKRTIPVKPGKRRNQGKQPTKLGVSLVKQKERILQDRRVNPKTKLHVTDVQEGQLSSVLDRADLDDWIEQAIQSNKEFAATKEKLVVMGPEVVTKVVNGGMTGNYEVMKIPRRPLWTKDMDKDALEQQESAAFLEWRKHLAELEENALGEKYLTPFEKNIQVWKQLWRVLERSDVVVQILDARNPLLFRSPDLEAYISEINPQKRCVLLLNKADYLSKEARRSWRKYFETQGVDCVFFSAVREQAKLEAELKKQRDQARQEEEEEYNAMRRQELDGGASAVRFKGEDEEEEEGGEEETEQAQAEKETPEQEAPGKDQDILSREAVLEYLEGKTQVRTGPDGRAVIGFVGYPNVGKSSTLNVLLGEKKVSISATPGKTKHFQTHVLGQRIMLCDCPGLVFPTFSSSRPELVCSGVLPIDTIRDPLPSVQLVCERIAPAQFFEQYSLRFAEDSKLDPYLLLRSHAAMRGYFKFGGEPDVSRSARTLLKDYVNGKLLFCYPPPSLTEKQRQRFYHSFVTDPPPFFTEGYVVVANKIQANKTGNKDPKENLPSSSSSSSSESAGDDAAAASSSSFSSSPSSSPSSRSSSSAPSSSSSLTSDSPSSSSPTSSSSLPTEQQNYPAEADEDNAAVASIRPIQIGATAESSYPSAHTSLTTLEDQILEKMLIEDGTMPDAKMNPAEALAAAVNPSSVGTSAATERAVRLRGRKNAKMEKRARNEGKKKKNKHALKHEMARGLVPAREATAEAVGVKSRKQPAAAFLGKPTWEVA
eukprot:g6449.t1